MLQQVQNSRFKIQVHTIPNICGNIKTNHDSTVHHQTELNRVGASEKMIMHGQVAEHVKS